MSLEKEEFTGKDVNYYLVEVKEPKRLAPYTAECEDIIEALCMTFAEGCEFKALWRSCAARTLSKHKKGQDKDGVYDAEKQVYYANRTLSQRLKERRQSELNFPATTELKPFPPLPLVYEPLPTQKVPLDSSEPSVKLVAEPYKLTKAPVVGKDSLCSHSFRDHNCGCTTLLHKECHKTFEDCMSFGNTARFGGFPNLDDIQARG